MISGGDKSCRILAGLRSPFEFFGCSIPPSIQSSVIDSVIYPKRHKKGQHVVLSLPQDTDASPTRPYLLAQPGNVNAGSLRISPPAIADSWARMPVQVQLAD